MTSARTWERTVPAHAIIFGIYVAIGACSVLLGNYEQSAFLKSNWLPLGIAAAAIIVRGYDALLPIAFGALSVNVFGDIASPSLLLMTTVGDTLQPLVMLWILHRLAFNADLQNLKDIALLLGAGFISTVIPATMHALSFTITSAPLESAATTWWWMSWWLGGVTSILVVVPLVLSFRTHTNGSMRTLWQSKEFLLSLGLLTLLAGMSVFTPFMPAVWWDSFTFASVIVLLMWIALRFGILSTSTALLIIALISFADALVGAHAAERSLDQRIFATELFVFLLTFIYTVIAAIEEQRKNATEKLAGHMLEIERSLRQTRSEGVAKNEFIAVLAHELRNPLALIDNSTQLLKLHMPRSTKTLHLADLILAEVATMSRLLDDLLDISRITQRKFILKHELVDVRRVLERALHSTVVLMTQRHHIVHTSFPKHRLYIIGDTARIEQIAVNLLTNAAKYTPPGGTIELGLASTRGLAVIRVKDNGGGIPREMLQRIFEPFVQITQHKEMASQTSSLGIGLSITKNLVEMHGGSIEARSPGLNKGSEFIVRLPVHVADVSRMQTRVQTPRIKEQVSKSKQGFKILVVDDEVAIANGFKQLLEHVGGHTVSVAYTGRDAIMHARTERPDAIILDIGLPDIDGYEVAQQIRATDADVFLIALSGYGQKEDKDRALTSGFNEHLTKPAGVLAVQEILERVARP